MKKNRHIGHSNAPEKCCRKHWRAFTVRIIGKRIFLLRFSCQEGRGVRGMLNSLNSAFPGSRSLNHPDIAVFDRKIAGQAPGILGQQENLQMRVDRRNFRENRKILLTAHSHVAEKCNECHTARIAKIDDCFSDVPQEKEALAPIAERPVEGGIHFPILSDHYNFARHISFTLQALNLLKSELCSA